MAEVSFLNVLKWSDEECRDYLEMQRWPTGPVCPKCGAENPYRISRKSATKNLVKNLYRCRECRKDYTATVGTIFEDSKIPLSKWFAAIYLMCASKKGMSAHQIHRELDVTYKSAWFMCHRIREAMRDKDLFPLTGTVEADETYIYPHRKRGHKVLHERIRDEEQMGIRKPGPKGPTLEGKQVVFGIKERGGRVRSIVVPDNKARTLRPLLHQHVDPSARLMTDQAAVYRTIKGHLHHEMINHEIEYVRGDVHTQGIEGYWSILKRGLNGTFHHVGVGYLGHYLHEFEFRFNSRKTSDAERFSALMAQMQGRVEWFCQNPQPENPFA